MPRRGALLRAALLVPLLAVGLASFIYIRMEQVSAGALIARQQQARALTPAAVSRVVRTAPDPFGHEKAAAASCVPLGGGELRNPWRCLLRYPTGRRIQYRVTVNANGSYAGADELVLAPRPRHRDTGTISGCCVALP